jgi:hypothetical protein
MLGYSQVPNVQGGSSILCALGGLSNAAGGSAGASVSTAVTATLTDQFGNGRLPNSYAVVVSPSQACLVSIGSKTSSSFNVILTPSPATATLAVGSFDVIVIG